MRLWLERVSTLLVLLLAFGLLLLCWMPAYVGVDNGDRPNRVGRPVRINR